MFQVNIIISSLADSLSASKSGFNIDFKYSIIVNLFVLNISLSKFVSGNSGNIPQNSGKTQFMGVNVSFILRVCLLPKSVNKLSGLRR